MTRRIAAAMGFSTIATWSADALAEPGVAELQRNLDHLWIIVAAGLVLLMQAGFLLLEAGMVRSKNSINVAQKNLLDMAFSGVTFAAVGFMVAFGTSLVLPFGHSAGFFFLNDLTAWQAVFFVFQVMFCATAATIVSGAIAERMRLTAYILASVAVALVIYPVFVHWAWGNALFDNGSAFLARWGFVDFAGSTVVHATGAWVALAACIVIGARNGRFAENGAVVRIAGHSPVLTAAGALLLFVGWIGFNGGSALAATPAVAGIVANTVLAAGAGAAAGYLAGWQAAGIVFPEKAISGLLGGLVAITAGCAVLQPLGALLVGVLGGLVAVWSNAWLETRLRIDDAVGAIGVHGFAGVAGTLALALLAPVEALPLASRLDQLAVQAAGVGINFVWSFGTGLLLFLVLGRFVALRATPEDEELGLNEAEHGTRLGAGHVSQALSALVAGNADLAIRLDRAPGDEFEDLTSLFNQLMANLEAEERARRRAAEERRDAEEGERLSALANATFEAIWIHEGGLIIDGNRRLEDLFERPLSELRGRNIFDLIAAEHHQEARQAMLKEDAPPCEVEVIGGRGDRIPVQIRGREIDYRGIRARIGCLVDLRERKAAELRIRHMAQHDVLTGLPNRSLFTERLEAMVARCDGVSRQGAVLMIDLDRFKDINDVHGHPAGDEVIRACAQRLCALVGPHDTVARLGGDEFAIVLPSLALGNQAGDLAFRIVGSLARPIDIGAGKAVRCGASVGVALCPRDGWTAEKLISRADTALYVAKNAGRNGFRMFEEVMEVENEKRRLIEADLDDAIAKDQFEVHYQPRVDVVRKTVLSYEALVRWRHPEKGLVSPADFIPVAEQSGKIVGIGEWVMRTACRAAVEHLGHARVSVNVSPVQFRQAEFVEMVEAIIRETGIDAGRLEIEITEGILIDDDRRATMILRELKKLGVTVALDDFGTGYSALSYLGRFPIDTIKIDRSFVHQLTASQSARAIVGTIVSLGAGLKMSVVAEGVETIEEARLLAAMGCRELQGFLLGYPVPIGQCPVAKPDVLEEIGTPDPAAMAGALNAVADTMRGADRDDGAGVANVA